MTIDDVSTREQRENCGVLAFEEDDGSMDPGHRSEVNCALSSLENLESVILVHFAIVNAVTAAGRCRCDCVSFL